MSLASVPQVAASALEATRAAVTPVLAGITPAARGAAARRLTTALRERKVTAQALREAANQGDRGVFSLLESLVAKPPAIKVSQKAMESAAACGNLTPATLQSFQRWLVRLHRDGDIRKGDLRAIRGKEDIGRVLDAIQIGWCRRVNRINDGLALPQLRKPGTLFAMSPVPIMHAVWEISQGTRYIGIEGIDGESQDRIADGVVVELAAFPLVRMPSHPIESPDFHRAFCGVWTALSKAETHGFCTPLAHIWAICDGGHVDEILQDTIDHAAWDGDVPTLSAASLEQLRDLWWDPEEVGTDALGDLYRHMDYRRRERKLGTWKWQGSQVTRWMDAGGSPDDVALVRGLGDLEAILRAAPTAPPLPRHTWNMSAPPGVAPIPYNHGLDDYLNPYYEQSFDGDEAPAGCIGVHSPGNTDGLFATIDRVIVEALVMTAAYNLLLDYHDATRKPKHKSA